MCSVVSDYQGVCVSCNFLRPTGGVVVAVSQRSLVTDSHCKSKHKKKVPKAPLDTYKENNKTLKLFLKLDLPSQFVAQFYDARHGVFAIPIIDIVIIYRIIGESSGNRILRTSVRPLFAIRQTLHHRLEG